MAINEFDQAREDFSAGSAPDLPNVAPAPQVSAPLSPSPKVVPIVQSEGPNPYQVMFDQYASDQKQAISLSLFAASKADPDKTAKAADLAQKTGLPVDVVERNYDQVKQDHDLEANKYQVLYNEHPEVARWFENPTNAAVGKDDVPALQNLESTVNDISTTQKITSSLYTALGQTMGGFSKVPGALVDVALLPGNQIIRLGNAITGSNNEQLRSPEFLRNNESTQYWDNLVKANNFDDLNTSIIQAASEGNYAKAGKAAAYQIATNAPQSALTLIAAIATGGAGSLPVVATLFGLPTLGNQNTIAQASGATPANATTDAVINAAAEVGGEYLPLHGIEKWAGSITRSLGKNAAKEVITSMMKVMAGAFATEALGEGSTQAVEYVADQLTGVSGQPFSFKDLVQQTADAAIIGGLSGVSMTGPAAISTGANRYAALRSQQQQSEAAQTKESYLKIGEAAEQTKLRTRLPQAQQRLINQMTSGTGAQDVFISPEALDVYYQKKELNPLSEMQKIGAADAYNEAKETGTDVKIPLAQWVDQVGKSEHYQGLADDVKFSAGSLSVNEAAQEKAQTEEALKIADESAQQLDAKQTAEAEVTSIRKNIRDQLISTGLPSSEATANAQLVEAGIRTLAEKTGQSPKQLFDQFGLTINHSTVQEAAEVPAPRTLLQKLTDAVGITQAPQSKPSAVFFAYQEMEDGQLALYNLFNAGDQTGSTVSRGTLEAQGIEVPPTPTVQEYQADPKGFQAKAREYKQDGNEGARGNIQVFATHANINLLKNADRSTFIHELGHFYLEAMGKSAKLEEASAGLKEDYQTILNYLGVQEGESIKEEQHETFARSFEAYLMEGKAPSSKLRKAFASFKVWLTGVYKNLKSLNVQLTDDVRQVFDRLLASEDMIESAEREQNRPFFGTDPAAYGMNAEQADEYKAAVEESYNNAKTHLDQKLLEDLKKVQRKEYKNALKTVTAEITAEVNDRPDYNAFSILERGETAAGEPIDFNTGPMKISPSSVVSQFSEEFLKTLSPSILDEKLGAPADLYAEDLGYNSGEELLYALSNLEPKEKAIERLSNERMQELYPDLLTSPALSEEAMKSTHLEDRSKVLRMQLDHLASNNPALFKDVIRRVVRRVPADSVVKAQAEKIVSAKKVSELSPYLYQRAEAKQAKLAGELLAKGDIDGAFQAKMKEYLNFELYRSAQNAQEQIQKTLDLAKKFRGSDEKLSKTRDMDVVNAGRSLLAQHGLSNFSARSEDYLESMKAYNPEGYATIKAIVDAASFGEDYKSLTFSEFQSLSDATEALWSFSRSSQQVVLGERKFDREAAAKELENVFLTFTSDKKAKAKFVETATKIGKVSKFLDSGKAATTRMEHWAHAFNVDDAKVNAPTELVWRPVSEAADKVRHERGVISKEVEKIAEEWAKGEKEITPILAHELVNKDGKPFRFKGKHELLGALLHRGNDSNFSKLLRGREWGSLNEDKTLNRDAWDRFEKRMWDDGILTKKDYDTVQKTWDLISTLLPGLQKANRQMHGTYFSEIQANKFVTPFGTYEGGYMPAVIDRNAYGPQELRKNKEILDQMAITYAMPTTGRGATLSRNERFAAPLLMDFRSVNSHIDWALKFTYLEPVVRDVHKILNAQNVQESLQNLDPEAMNSMINPWLKTAASQMVSKPSETDFFKGLDKISRFVRTRVSQQLLAFNVTNSVQNLANVPVLFTTTKAAHVANAFRKMALNPNQMASAIAEKSIMMNTRLSNQTQLAAERIDEYMTMPSQLEKGSEGLRKLGGILQSFTQNPMDLLSWQSKYDESIAKGLDEKESIKRADANVRQTQGSYSPEDRTFFETGTESAALFKMFAGFFVNSVSFTRAQMTLAERKGQIGKLTNNEVRIRKAKILSLSFILTSYLAEAVARSLSGQGLDADDDGHYLDDLLSFFFVTPVRFGLAAIPYAGTLGNAVISRFNDKVYDDRITASPAISGGESLLNAGKELVDLALQKRNKDGSKKKVDSKTIRDVATLVGVSTNLPILPLTKPFIYFKGIQDRKIKQPTGPIDAVRGAVTGRGEKRK